MTKALFSASGKTSSTGIEQSPAWHYSNVVGQQLLETVVEAGHTQTQRPLRKHGSLKGRVKLQ
jgi:hypothetical protein